jgi:hypothetical protein
VPFGLSSLITTRCRSSRSCTPFATTRLGMRYRLAASFLGWGPWCAPVHPLCRRRRCSRARSSRQWLPPLTPVLRCSWVWHVWVRLAPVCLLAFLRMSVLPLSLPRVGRGSWSWVARTWSGLSAMQQKAEIDTEHLNLNLNLNANANAKPSALLKRQAAGAVRFFWGGFFVNVICYLVYPGGLLAAGSGAQQAVPRNAKWHQSGGAASPLVDGGAGLRGPFCVPWVGCWPGALPASSTHHVAAPSAATTTTPGCIIFALPSAASLWPVISYVRHTSSPDSLPRIAASLRPSLPASSDLSSVAVVWI